MELLKGFAFNNVQVQPLAAGLGSITWGDFQTPNIGSSQGGTDEVRLYAIDGAYVLALNDASTGTPDYLIQIRPGESVNISRFTGMRYFAILGPSTVNVNSALTLVDQSFVTVAHR